MANQKRPVPRWQIVLFYAALIALIAFSGWCVYLTHGYLG